MHYLKRGVWLFGLVLAAQTAFAQRTVTGTLTDAASGDPLIGAYIIATGTDKGTVADFDGKYSLEVPAGVESLTVSYTGYANQVVAINGRSVVDIAMQAGTQLEEVVVIGYGTVKREDATGSVETVSARDFNKGAITSAQELVSGKVAGVQITTDGSPGGGAQIRIRGGSSLSASNDPLIVIDGVPLAGGGINGSRNPLNLINPNDIETFTVLKDASATAIYGSRASNGVIIITTKKGKAGDDLQLSYNGSVGVANPINQLDVLNGNEFRTLLTDRFGSESAEVGILGEANTDWQDQVLQSALFTDHNISAAGAVGVLPYRVSAGYTNQEGVLKTDNFERITYGLNLSPSFFENRLQLQVGLKGVSTNNRFADRGALGAAVAFDPTQPVFEDNDFGGYYFSRDNSGNRAVLAPNNPLALLEQTFDESTVNRYIANFSADYRFSFLPALRANLNLASDRANTEGTKFIPTTAAFAIDPGSSGGANNRYEQTKINDLLEFYLNYNKDFEGVRLDVMGGYSWQNFSEESSFRNSRIDGSDLEEGIDAGEYFLLSLFSRVNVGIGERLNLTATLRRDGSSRFSEDNRWGLFPSAAAAYNLVNVDNNPKGLNRLKLRVGYGVTGQQEIGGFYPGQATYLGSFDNARYQFGDRFITTLRPNGYNADLKWEETTTINFAVDFGFFDDRLGGTVEYFNRRTNDLLSFVPVPAGTNLTNFVNTNVGDLMGNGIEIGINATPYRKANSELSFGINLTLLNAEITKLTATEDPDYPGVPVGGIAGGVGNNIQIHRVGFAPSSFLVFEQVYDENSNPVEGVYVDRNGDGTITTDDQYVYENPAADAFLGFTMNYNVNNFDFSFAGRASFGNHVYDNNLSNRALYSTIVNRDGFVTNTVPEITEVDFANPQYFSDFYIRDASFLRLDHITAGYRFDDVVGAGSSIRTFLTVQNPFVISDYDGLDPEVQGGIDNNIYPRSRTILLGVGVNF